MRAVLVERTGGPEVMEVTDRPAPQPASGQLLVDVAAAGVNFIDIYFRTGAYPVSPPFVLGQEGSGRVAAIGAGVQGWEVGDRVAWVDQQGSYAEQAVVRADRALRVPDEVDDRVAAAIPLQGMTAHYLTISTYPVAVGDDVLVHAAAGGVGLLLTQAVTSRGGRVIATVSTAEKAELARSAGAAEVIRYDQEDFTARVRELTGGRGVQVVYDGVGAATFDGSLASLAVRGMLVQYGSSSGKPAPFDIARLQAGGSLFVTRPTLGHYVADSVELGRRAADVFAWVADGTLSVRIGGTYPLEDAARAHEDLQGRRTTGKLLLIP